MLIMCGIAGSTTLEKLKVLYSLNKDRGIFANSLAFKQHNTFKVIKSQGELSLSTYTEPYDFVLLHTQAPTSSIREWSAETSHPFECGNWIVAHNGIISNFEKLKRQYVNITHHNEVDSSIIPALLDCFESKGVNGHEMLIIKEVAELLEGTFACWIYSKITGQVYIIRCSSTLFADNYGNFSSVVFDNSFPLNEGVVYKLNNGLHTMTKFKYNSPFFAL